MAPVLGLNTALTLDFQRLVELSSMMEVNGPNIDGNGSNKELNERQKSVSQF